MSSDSILDLDREAIERLTDPKILLKGLLELYDAEHRMTPDEMKDAIDGLDRKAEIAAAVAEQMERDCRATCMWCRGVADEFVSSHQEKPEKVNGKWVHERRQQGGLPMYSSCTASLIREASHD